MLVGCSVLGVLLRYLSHNNSWLSSYLDTSGSGGQKSVNRWLTILVAVRCKICVSFRFLCGREEEVESLRLQCFLEELNLEVWCSIPYTSKQKVWG